MLAPYSSPLRNTGTGADKQQKHLGVDQEEGQVARENFSPT